MSRFGLTLAPGAALAVALLLSGCALSTPQLILPSPSPTYAPTGDGVLRIGTILSSGAVAQVAGVEVAVREINEQGGIAGAPVEVYHRPAGDPGTQTAEDSLADLVAKGVDVVIGPDSAELAERLVGPAADAGVALVSPSAAGLGGVEDSGLLFSTAVAPAAEGAALAAELGEAAVAVLSFGDDAATTLLDSLTAALTDAGGEVVYSGVFADVDTDFTTSVSATKKAKPDAVVVTAASPEQAALLLTALQGAGFDGSSIWLTSRSAWNLSALLPAGTLEGASAITRESPADEFLVRLRQADPAVAAYGAAFGAEAYDATMLAALAVVINGDDGGPAISRHLRSVSTGGIPCASFGECLSVLETEKDIDFTGASGPVDLDGSGDAARASFSILAYDAANAPSPARVVSAG